MVRCVGDAQEMRRLSDAMEVNMSNVRLRIAELRRKKHISQQQLADVVGVSFQTISKWENGHAMPDITNLPVLAEYFNVPVKNFFEE